MEGKRRFEVSGIDDLGDLHTFATDSRERADEILAKMRDDLEDVELQENEWPDPIATESPRS